MATVHITFRNAVSVGGSSINGPVRASAQIVSSASSQAAGITAKAGEVATIKSAGGTVYAATGNSPTAVSGEGDMIRDGETVDILMSAGQTVAVID